MESQRRPFRSEARPEILPPGAPVPDYDPSPGYRPPDYGSRPFVPPPGPPPEPRRRRKWAFAPATYLLLGINTLVFLAMLDPNINNWALDAGSTYGMRELRFGEWYRLLTSAFVHYGIIHFAGNMWCLWNLGMLGESLLGFYGLIATYLVTGLAAGLLSTAVHPEIQSVGASGAIFGIAGVLIMLLKSPLLPVPPAELKRLRRSVIMFAVLNFVIGAGVWVARTELQIDNMAHLGGFLGGLALGVPLVPKIGAPRGLFVQRQWLAFSGGAFVLLLLAYGIYRSYFG